MVRNGATIKEVADVLGHQSIATAQIYVKLDEPALQSVALPWPGAEL
jgi:site-specific recombinase XerD